MGYEIAMVTANDVDLAPVLTYSFTRDGNPGHVLSIEQSSGRLVLARRLDHEGFGVSYSTLRRRVLRPGDYVEKLPRGYKPLFSIQEEKELVNHVSMFAEYGYGYTISELAELASELGVEKGYIKEPLSRSWVQRFLKRNPELRLDRPRPLDIYRAKAADRDNIARFANFR